jgi:hypothetical protein
MTDKSDATDVGAAGQHHAVGGQRACIRVDTQAGPPDARSVLAATPTPAQVAKLTPARLPRLLVEAGRAATWIVTSTGSTPSSPTPACTNPPMVENAMGIQLTTLLRQFGAACTATDELAEAAIVHFRQHQLSGLAALAGAQVLTEIDDDRSRADAHGLQAFAGSAPIARASGKKPLCCNGISRTSVCPRSRRIWRSPPCSLSGRTTLRCPTAPPETGTTKPNGPCSPDFSDNSTTACTPASSTTNTRRFHPLSRTRLDYINITS